MIRLVAWAVLVMVSARCVSADVASERASRLRARIMAPCCWSETLTDHKSPLADALRREIDERIAAGESDREIVAALKQRYGRRILAEPDGRSGTLLRTMPFVVLGLGAVWAVFLLRRWTRPSPGVTVTPS